ncbi:MAG: hypothetical protein RLZZ28_1781 [Bacteroidota bacterium]|jgi:nitroreductase
MTKFNLLQNIIHSRRSTKPDAMNGQVIDNQSIQQLLELAHWAPTHGRTEPWRFVVFEKAAKQQFFLDHANLYKTHTPAEKFATAKYEKIKEQGKLISHLVVVYMKRSLNNSIPEIEEIAAVSAAIQNILLAATAAELASFWSTGGMTHHPSMKEYLHLDKQDTILGLLMLGYSDGPAIAGKRDSEISSKIEWKQ